MIERILIKLDRRVEVLWLDGSVDRCNIPRCTPTGGIRNKKKVRADMMPCSDESCLLILGRFLAIDFQKVVECYIKLHLLHFSH